jgi:HD-GYP domain-containing protein (c-di-GMP phosphodiesterase class II)
MVAAYCVHHRQTVNIPDAYQAEEFDFSGTRAFDKQTGYRSQSFLTMPLANHRNEVIGVLQLINKIDAASGRVLSFSPADQHLAESLASQAAVTLTKNILIDQLEQLFDALIKLIATTIDEKSPYTGAHCKRVPALTMLLADAADACADGPLKDFRLSADERYALEVAAWLHDCGKVSTPEHVRDKGSKLETVFDRIELINSRLEILRRDAEIASLQQRLAAARAGDEQAAARHEQELHDKLARVDTWQAFLARCNTGSESMSDEDQQQVRDIAAHTWQAADGSRRTLLTDDEIDNLTIPYGTLNQEERRIINRHIDITIKMLESLPFPRHLRNVPEYAGGHHERMDGKGYPKGLTREQMSIPARVMGIADVFEALTAQDRPYKKAYTLSKALQILGRMKQEHHIDPDLFDVFVNQKVFLEYARQLLPAEQIDVDDPSEIPGYPFD